MASNIELLIEAERRGILPPDKAALLGEARKRGLAPMSTGQLVEQKEGPKTWATSGYKAYAPEDNMDFTGKGVLMGVTDPVYGAGQLVPRGLEKVTSVGGKFPNPVSRAYERSYKKQDAAVQEREKKYQESREGGFDAGRLAGNVISPVNLMSIPGVPKNASFWSKLLNSGSGAAGYASLMPVMDTDNYGKEKIKQAGAGFLGGAAGQAVGSGVNRVLNPQTSSASRTLMNEGVELTPGQILGGKFKSAEDKLSSVPVVGGMINRAQKRGVESLNNVAINRSLDPIGKSLPRGIKGREAIEFAQNQLSQAYDDILPRLKGQFDEQFDNEFLSLSQGVADTLPQEQAKRFAKIVESQLNKKTTNGKFTGERLKEIQSELTRLSNGYKSDASFDNRNLGEAISELNDMLRGVVKRSNPEQAEALSKIDKGYANFKRVQKAASSVATDEGVFTPAQLQNAVKALDRSKDKSSFAKGKALMQDLSDPAKAVLPQSVPNSGTVDRATLAALLGVGTSTAAPSLAPAAIPAALAAGMYTRPGQIAMEYLLARRPQSVRALGPIAAKVAPYLGGPLALPFLAK